MTKTYSYDASGNNTGIVATLATGGASTTQETVTMDYDGLNRMTSWSRAEAGATLQTETHGYRGAEWHRRSTSANGVSTSFLYDGDNVLVDYVTTGGGGATFDRLYVTPFLDQNLSMSLAAGAAGNTSGSEQAYYYSQDGLGSVRTLTDSSGAVKNRYDYLAFGEPAPAGIHASGYEAKEELPQRYTYTGREQSVYELAPMYYRWRMYAPSVGRFTARDPLGYEGGMDLYAYVANRPYGLVDSYGLIKLTGTVNSHGSVEDVGFFTDTSISEQGNAAGGSNSSGTFSAHGDGNHIFQRVSGLGTSSIQIWSYGTTSRPQYGYWDLSMGATVGDLVMENDDCECGCIYVWSYADVKVTGEPSTRNPAHAQGLSVDGVMAYKHQGFGKGNSPAYAFTLHNLDIGNNESLGTVSSGIIWDHDKNGSSTVTGYVHISISATCACNE